MKLEDSKVYNRLHDAVQGVKGLVDAAGESIEMTPQIVEGTVKVCTPGSPEGSDKPRKAAGGTPEQQVREEEQNTSLRPFFHVPEILKIHGSVGDLAAAG